MDPSPLNPPFPRHPSPSFPHPKTHPPHTGPKMRRPQVATLLLLLLSLVPVHAQDPEPELDGVWVDATSDAKAWLDSGRWCLTIPSSLPLLPQPPPPPLPPSLSSPGNSLPFPVALSPEAVGMSSPHLAEADGKIESLVKDSTYRAEGGREGREGGREG